MSYEKEQAAKLLAGLPAHLVQHFPVCVHTIDGPLNILSVYRVEGVLTVDVEQPVPAAPPTWNGPEDGLPPVGVKVTIENPQGYGLICDEAEWLGPEVTVVHTYRNPFGVELVVVERDDGAAQVFRASMCRPIRTAEQLAAEERERGITGLVNASSSDEHPGITRMHAAALYDAGARMPGEGSKA